MAQIIQVCRKLILLFIFVFIFKEVYSLDKKPNDYGNFLSWNYAKEKSDLNRLQELFNTLDINSIDKGFYEEMLFQAVIFEDWGNSRIISEKILDQDKKNLLANSFMIVDGYLNSRSIKKYLKEIDSSTFDMNFIRALNIWVNFDTKNSLTIDDDCVPIICLHSALFYRNKNKKLESNTFFNKIEQEEFASFRLKEILILNAIENNEYENVLKKNEELKKFKINFQDHGIEFLKKNTNLLNPIYNQQDGLAEVFYNISSWYYSNDLNIYAAFFGQLSMRLREDFNAMKLLLSGVFNQLNLEKIALQNIEKIEEDNIYFYKIFKMKLAFLEKLNMDQLFIKEVESFIKKFPDQPEIKRILGDKYRKLKNYEKAIYIYSELVNNNDFSNPSGILYSRGISYERLSKWKNAEKDFKQSLILNPNDPYVMNYLAYSWLDRKINIDEALNLLIKAINLEPTDGYIMDSLGWAYFLSHDFENSVIHLEKAVAILPNDATLNDHLGDAYWMTNRKFEAKSQWKKVLILDPDYKEIKKVKKKISKGL